MMLHYIKLFERKCLILATSKYLVAQLMQLITSKRRNLITTYKKEYLLNIKRRISGESKIKKIFLSAETLSSIKKTSLIK